MEPRADQFKAYKRMRLNHSGVSGIAYTCDISREDANQLELGIGLADHTNTTSLFDPASCLENETSHGFHPHISNRALPGSMSSVNLSRGLGLVARTDAAGSFGLTMTLPNRPFEAQSWNSTDSMQVEHPKEHDALPEVDLGLGLNIAPVASSADSALTSFCYGSINHIDTSSIVNSETPPSSFLYQDGSLHNYFSANASMIDEGSTSNGTNMLPYLKSHPSVGVLTSDAQIFKPSLAAIPQSVVETDNPMSFKASSGTTSTSGASSGIGERAAKICRFTGCSKRARGASGLCISHGGGRRCQRPFCNKGAEGSTIFCKAHGGGRRCESLGCTKSAEGKTEFCIAHGGGSRCSFEGCTKAARGRTRFCIRHGGGKRCKQEGCTKSAEGYSALCIAHGGGKRCQYPNCNKGAQGSTLLCKGHGGGKRCTVEGCNKGAEGSTSLCKGHGGGKRCMFEGGGICSKSVHGGTSYCVAHGGGKRCIVQGCTKSARGRTDSCVKHGGGKRCKFENCDKSAQGSTDFCKAHGGGKRCTWGQEGSMTNDTQIRYDFLEGSCDKYAKGKLSLCSEHSALVEDQRVHGTDTFGCTLSSRMEASLSESSSLKEENLLSIFGASGHFPQAMKDDSHVDEGIEMRLKPSASHRPSPQEGDGWHPQGFQLSKLPSVIGVHGGGKNYTSSHYPVKASMENLWSKQASMLQPSVSSQMFGRPPTMMQWPPAIGRPDKRRESTPSNAEDDTIFNMSSLSLPEERVHGGNIMALFSGERPK